MSSARRLHHVLELQEGLVGGLSIALRHLGHHVRANVAAQVELGDSVVDIHGLGLPSRCHHVADGSVVSQDSCLQGRRVHCCPHLQHAVDGLEHRCRGLSGHLGIDIRSPVDLLEEGIGSLRELLGCIINLVCISRCCTKHASSSCSCAHGHSAASWGRHECILQLADCSNCCCSNEHLACLGHSACRWEL